MSETREWWIFKGTSNFCSELELDEDDLTTLRRQKPDDFYDIISDKDTIEGGIHVVEYAALKAAQAENGALKEKLAEAVKLVNEFRKTLHDFSPTAVAIDETLKRIEGGE